MRWGENKKQWQPLNKRDDSQPLRGQRVHLLSRQELYKDVKGEKKQQRVLSRSLSSFFERQVKDLREDLLLRQSGSRQKFVGRKTYIERRVDRKSQWKSEPLIKFTLLTI